MHCTLSFLEPFHVLSGRHLLLCRHAPALTGQEVLISSDPISPLAVGSCLGPDSRRAWLTVQGHSWIPGNAPGREAGLWIRAETDIQSRDLPRRLEIWKSGYTLAWVTLSDSGAAGRRTDGSGPLIPELIGEALPLCLHQGFLLGDEAPEIRALLTHLALMEGFDLIVTTGGTGVAPRDVTADVTADVLDKRLPGFEQAMLASSLAVTPHAAISRAVAGILGSSLIINLPGSPKGVRENLAPLLPALEHTLAKLHGDPTECGTS